MSSILNYRPYERIKKNGRIKKRYLPRVSQVIKVAAGVNKNLSLYTSRFDQGLISAGFRLAYFEFEPRKRIVDTTNLDNLFNRYNNCWIALRNPFIPDNDYIFLVMAADMTSIFSTIVRNLITEGKTSTIIRFNPDISCDVLYCEDVMPYGIGNAKMIHTFMSDEIFKNDTGTMTLCIEFLKKIYPQCVINDFINESLFEKVENMW